jgi:hypothetical protein
MDDTERRSALEPEPQVRATAQPLGAAARRPAAAAQIPPRMGGIALKNGLILVSDDYWAVAVRESDGAISVASGRKPHLPAGGGAWARRGAGRGAPARPQVADLQGLPMLRGLARFGETLLVMAGVKLRMPQAELPLEGGRVLAALVASYAGTSAIRSVGPKSAVVQETGAALAAFVPAVLSLRNSAISGYHGAEHKVIAGREAELRAAAAGVPYAARAGQASAAAGAPKEHDRCGSNLVGPLLFTTIAANALIRGTSRRMTPAGSAIAGALSLGAALEALRWATRHGDSLAARVLMSPGRIIQKTLTTTEPTSDQLEVAQRAMKELLRAEAAGA